MPLQTICNGVTNKQTSPYNAKRDEQIIEPKEQSYTDNGKATITPMSKDHLMGIY